MRIPESRRGSAAADVVIGAAVIVFVILPLFAFIFEKYLIFNKAQIIKDAVDMTNISVYNAMNTGQLGKEDIDIDTDKAMDIYKSLLAENLKLDESLLPLRDSLAEDRVCVKSLAVFSAGFPQTCPEGINITRPTVHSVISVPVRPSLYRRLILSKMGRQYVELEVHVDSEIPVNN